VTRRHRLGLALIALTGALLASSATASAAFFQSPSKNIGCYIAKGGARCDIRERDWEPPPPPASCELDYGQGLGVDRKGRGAFVCAGDTVLNPSARLLGYGKSIERGRFRCTSKRSGVKCVNERNGHGFKLSRARPIRF
jgi:hypothetical protein